MAGERRPRGADYDRRFEDLAATGMDMHGEAALVDSYGPGSVLDAGCGTGRVAIELSRRGHPSSGSTSTRPCSSRHAPRRPTSSGCAATWPTPGSNSGRTFDVVVMAGNVLIFVPSGSEEQVIANAARWLRPGGRLVSGYSLRRAASVPRQHDALAARAGLVLQDRWSTWDRHPFSPGDRYAVAVHRREALSPLRAATQRSSNSEASVMH